MRRWLKRPLWQDSFACCPSCVSSPISQRGKLRPAEVAQLPSPELHVPPPFILSSCQECDHPRAQNKKGPLFREMPEVGGGGVCWGIRKEPAGNSFVPGAPWGLELDLSPAKSPPERPPTCWEGLKPRRQGGPPEAVTPGQREPEEEGKRGREEAGRWGEVDQMERGGRLR